MRTFVRDIFYSLSQLSAGPAWKWAAAGFGSLAAAIYPDAALRDSVTVALCLVGADTILGVYAAWSSGEPIKSAKMRRVFGKLLAYTICTASLVWGLKAIQLTSIAIPASTGAIYLAITTELVSIIENAHKAGMKVPSWISAALKGKIEDLQGKNDSGDSPVKD